MEKGHFWHARSRIARFFLLAVAVSLVYFSWSISVLFFSDSTQSSRVPLHAEETIAKCLSLQLEPGPPKDFHERTVSDRFELGTKPVLIKHGKIITGDAEGAEVIHGDILIDKGIIQGVGHFGSAVLDSNYNSLEVIDAKGAWITPGIVDLHSHLGDGPAPELEGAVDDNSLKGTAQPWLRSLDGLNTHDESYRLSISGGITTALVLPGSANAIGGQAFVIKLRKTSERSPTSMLLEPPHQINNSSLDPSLPLRWRHMKHACGENPSRVYGDTRMDTLWHFRNSYNTATQIKKQQDEYCSKALAGHWETLGSFPENLQWEALVDVIRGRVKVNVHCYEAVDLDDLVRLSNEFQFPIAAFHHASEAYLVPEVIKKAYGKTPAVAIFATNARYKREAYRGSEFAPKILSDNNLTVIMKSDHPVLNSRYLLYEAQQAHYYGLPPNLALASVTSNSAQVMGLGHRIGHVKRGWDADLVIWDSHPLALGATPSQVLIDGIPQLSSPYVSRKPDSFQSPPQVPDFSIDAQKAVEYEGLPPLTPVKASSDLVVFTNVKSVFTRTASNVRTAFVAQAGEPYGVVIVRNGRILCAGLDSECDVVSTAGQDTPLFMDLEGGSISPGLVTFGASVGLEHIAGESSTNDGSVFDPLIGTVPTIMGGDSAVVRAVDGLEYLSRDALLAYRSGVTSAITAPSHRAFCSGLGTHFSTSATHKLEAGAVLKDITALHVSIRHFGIPSVSTQVAALRRLLLHSSEENWFKKVAEGKIPLVVEAHSADIIATLILLKKEVESQTGKILTLTITGAAEAHLLARELRQANVGVVVNPPRPFPYEWEDRRILPGPPFTEHTVISKLLTHNVTVGFGIEEIWSARNARFDIAWAALEADGKISKEEALALGSVNLEKLLGASVHSEESDSVATKGGDLLEMHSKVVAVVSPRRASVDLFN